MLKITGVVTLLMVGFISASHAEDSKSLRGEQRTSEAATPAVVQSAAAPMNDCPSAKASAPMAERDASPAVRDRDDMLDRLEGNGRF